MPTSGTTDFNLDILDIIEEAQEMVGIEPRGGYDIRTARRSLNLLLREWGNRGINLWTVKEESYPVTMGADAVTLAADTIDVLDAAWRTGTGLQQQDRIMTRYSMSQWAQTANKNQPGPPSQFYIERIMPAPIMQIWPVASVAGSVVVWKLRSMQDAGAYSNIMDVHVRFLPAMTTGLAYYMALKSPAATERVPMLQAEYDRQFNLAAEEDRDRASFFMIPDLSSYNR